MQIVDALAIQPKEHLVEIGPGEGILTEALLKKGCRLDAIEIDRDLIVGLKNRLGHFLSFRLHQADALQCDFQELSSHTSLRIVGNLPYNISTLLLFHLFEQVAVIRDIHVMLQKEVVDRLVATPGCSDYGRLSVMTQYYVQAEKLFDVYPDSFYPKPKVVSTVVRLLPHATRPVEVSIGMVRYVVTLAFNQRRKTLKNSLKSLFREEDWTALEMDSNARAEVLSLGDYAKLAQYLLAKGIEHR